MLYKKTHRQHVRLFQEGREFKYKSGSDVVYKITRKPRIGCTTIWVDCWSLVNLPTGRLSHKDDIVWLV